MLFLQGDVLNPQDYFNQLNDDYLALHRRKEDLFWQTYMGTSDDHDGFAAAEAELSAFISDPSHIQETRCNLDVLLQLTDEDDELVQGLKGWLAFFDANAIESAEGRDKMAALIRSESALFAKRQEHLMYFNDENGDKQQASLTVLAANIRTSNNESVRQSAHQALLGLEQWVLNNGYIELVKQRNDFARQQGFRNFTLAKWAA